MKFAEKIKGYFKNKNNVKYVLSVVLALIVGVSIGEANTVSQDQYNMIKGENTTLNEKITELKDLVETAQPYFDMTEIEKDRLAREAEELRKEEEKRRAEALSVTLGNGTYLVGKDIPEGVYDLYAVKGGGNVISTGQVNVIMGITGDDDFYQREQQNVALSQGTTIDLSGVTVKFVPDDSYVIKK